MASLGFRRQERVLGCGVAEAGARDRRSRETPVVYHDVYENNRGYAKLAGIAPIRILHNQRYLADGSGAGHRKKGELKKAG